MEFEQLNSDIRAREQRNNITGGDADRAVPNQKDLAKIAPLAQEIKGVKSVNVKATVAPAQPEANN